MVIHFDGKDYQFDPEEIDVRQAMVIKVKTGLNLLQWQAALEQADVDAIKALYWLMLAQNGVAADIDMVNFKLVKLMNAFNDAQKAEGEQEEDPTSPEPTVS